MSTDSLSSYFDALGVSATTTKTAALDAYFEGLGDAVVAKVAAPAPAQKDAASVALDAYFGKEADFLDQTPGQIGSNALHGLTGMLGDGTHAFGNGLADLGHRGMGLLGTVGNTLAEPVRALGGAAGSLVGGGTLRDAIGAGSHAGMDPIHASVDQMVHGAPGAAPTAPTAPSAMTTGAGPNILAAPATLPDGPAPSAKAPGPQVQLNGAPPAPPVAPSAPAAPKPPAPPAPPATPPAPGAPAPTAAPAAPATPANPQAPGKEWLDHFKTQTGSAYNPHSVVDRMKMMGFQKGLTGGQTDQLSSLSNRQGLVNGAGTAAGNTNLLNRIAPPSAPGSPSLAAR